MRGRHARGRRIQCALLHAALEICEPRYSTRQTFLLRKIRRRDEKSRIARVRLRRGRPVSRGAAGNPSAERHLVAERRKARATEERVTPVHPRSRRVPQPCTIVQRPANPHYLSLHILPSAPLVARISRSVLSVAPRASPPWPLSASHLARVRGWMGCCRKGGGVRRQLLRGR